MKEKISKEKLDALVEKIRERSKTPEGKKAIIARLEEAERFSSEYKRKTTPNIELLRKPFTI